MEPAESEESVWVYRKSFLLSQEMDKSTNNSTGLMPVVDITNKPLPETHENGNSAIAKTEKSVNSADMLTNNVKNHNHSNKDQNLRNHVANSANHCNQNGITHCPEKAQKQSTDICQDLTILTDHDVESIEDTPSSVISCHHISYRVEERKGKCGCGKLESRHILKNISGVFKPGLNVVMGPTGSGKTSLLDILAGRKDQSGLMGSVLVDGATQPTNFKCMAGYVTQDDVVMGMLTVKENISFSAALRLPSSVSTSRRNERVEEVIEELGLTKCANSKVGTEFVRGVSGGERKRTNIAMELITAPSVIFLDEPTTGLDSSMAFSVMSTLQRLGRRGKTVICSIHQPRYSIFKLFDHLLLLSQGEIVYQGPSQEALDYFESIGFVCEAHNNPSDFFLDVIGGDVEAPNINEVSEDSQEKLNGDAIISDDTSAVVVLESNESLDHVAVRHKYLTESFVESSWQKTLKASLKPYEEALGCNYPLTKNNIGYPTSFFQQMTVVSGRTLRNIIRNPHSLNTQLCSAIILGLIIGTIYFQLDSSQTTGIQNRVGVFFFIVMNYVFGNMAAVDTFIKERHNFIHENISGYYRVSTYFLSKIFCEVLPMRLPAIIIFACIAYWMIGLDPGAEHFAFFALNVLLTSLAGTSVALFFSATVRSHTVGTLLTALIWTFMMVFSGLLVNLESIIRGLRWVKWVSIFRYSMNAFLINELKGKKMCNGVAVMSMSNSSSIQQTRCDYGNDYMDTQGIIYDTTWDLWSNEVALVVITVVFCFLAYVQLRMMKKLR